MTHRSPLLSLARTAVVRSADWPLLGRLYRRTYQHQIERARAALARRVGIQGALLRGSSRSDFTPGLSDIDLVVLLEPNLDADDELDAVLGVADDLRRIGRPVPLVRDVHILTADEARVWAALGVYLLAAFRVDVEPLVGTLTWPDCTRSPDLVRESLLRGVAWWTDKGVRQHLYEAGYVGRRLAARSLEKSLRFSEALRGGADDLDEVMQRPILAPGSEPSDVRGCLAALERFDAALPDAPTVEAPPAPQPHPPVDDWRAAAERWLRPLRVEPALVAALLSVEGPLEHDLRLYVVVDPTHHRAADALHAVAAHVRGSSPLPATRFGRCPSLLVVTPRQLSRAVFLRWTALEPVYRDAYGQWLWGEPIPAAATPSEVGRSLLYDLANAPYRARALASGRIADSQAARWADLVAGLLPACTRFVEDAPLPRSYAAEAWPAHWEGFRRDIRTTAGVRRAYRTVCIQSRQLLPRLSERVLQTAQSLSWPRLSSPC